MIVTVIAGILASFTLNLVLQRQLKRQGGEIVRIFRILLLLGAVVIVLASATGNRLNPHLQVVCYLFFLAFLVIATLSSNFWEKMAYGTVIALFLMLGGYLYTQTQIPYGPQPFALIASNQPRPLEGTEMPLEWISGLPLSDSRGVPASLPYDPVIAPTPATTPRKSAKERELPEAHLRWNDVQPLMNRDSRIRDVLVALREKQDRDLTETLANLNQISVNGTSMRRHALDRVNIDNMLREGAISQARYHTMLETWALTDKDEQAFRSKQGEDLFHAVLQLLEDRAVDETNKVELIEFMVQRFHGDMRLMKPLINLYDQLDEDYPRQKRLNREFLSLYLQKRKAIINGFAAISRQGLQPLLDYRRKTIPEIRYSQCHLDRFLEQRFGIRIRPLYGVANPVAIHNFLNREKYPPLQKLSGPSYDQDYLRRSLIKTAAQNQVPAKGSAVMGLAPIKSADIPAAFGKGNPELADALMIDPDPAVRANLAWYLAERKDPYTVPLVFELMQDSHPEVRRLAAIAAGNFRILDMQSSNDLKFTETVRMLVNYRTNADSYARAFALSTLPTVGDRQKALYVIDLVLNDGKSVNSTLGHAAPAWKDEQEQLAVHSLIETLTETPEEPYIKTHALKVLLAMDSHESLGILLHYLQDIYADSGYRPGMLRYIVPHLTMPQEAENVEDMVSWMAASYRERHEPLEHILKTLRTYLSSAYQKHQSAEFFQYLRFLEEFSPEEFREYVDQTAEHVLLMRVTEYLHSTWLFWLVLWPILLVAFLILQYGFGLFISLSSDSPRSRRSANRYSNPASDIRNLRQAPAPAIVPVKIQSKRRSAGG